MVNHSITLQQIVETFGGRLLGDDAVITNVATVHSAQSGDIAFVDNAKYEKYIPQTKASAVILPENLVDAAPGSCIVHENPKLLFAKVVSHLKPRFRPEPGIHPTAVVDPSAQLEANVSIGPHAVIEAQAKIGQGTVIGAGCVIGRQVTIGAHGFFHANVTVASDTVIGDYCECHSGAVIGSDGFGFANDKGRWHKLPQVGRVCIGHHVEIGANTTIDRGAIDDTVIADGVILDNLIHIGHNVKIGQGTAIAAHCGIAGSCTIGAYCMIGGASVFNGHITIADRCYFIPGSQVANSITKPGVFSSGIPAKPREQWARNVARFAKLDELAVKVNKMNKRLSGLELAQEESKA